MENEKNNKFNKRAFISLGMFFSALGLPISGIMNHELGFEGLTVERHIWMSVHNVLGLLFVIFFIFHIIFNWKPLIKHFKNVSNHFISKEAIAAASVVLIFLFLIILHTLHS